MDPTAQVGSEAMPVIRRVEDFDRNSGGLFERAIFNNRLVILALCALASVFLAYQATHLQLNASYEQMLPQSHLYMRNYLENQHELNNLGNVVRIAVENTKGSIFDPEYLEVLRQVTDSVMVTKGVYRGWVKSLWLPSVRWTDVTEEGFVGGPVMPADFDGSPATIEQLQVNVQRAKIIGNLVSADLKSSMIVVPLLDIDPETGDALDYAELAENIESGVRAVQTDAVRIHPVGFAVLIGLLIDGLNELVRFFLAAVVIAAAIIFGYSRCVRSTLLLISMSLLGVIWLLGLIALSGHALNPYSILVPFLVFAIGISHGTQKMNGIAQDVARGMHHYVAARYTFRRLFLTGLTALLTNVVGFAVLMVVDIPVIREMALITSVGVSVLIITKLVLIPVVLSYIGVSRTAAERRLRLDEKRDRGERFAGLRIFEKFCQPRWARSAVAVAGVLTIVSLVIGTKLQVGDLDPGAPELWPASVYNQDVDFINRNFGLSSDQFAVIVKTPPYGGQRHETLIEMERLAWLLQQDPSVQAIASVAESVPFVNMGQFEGNPKWMTIPRNSNAGAAVYTIYAAVGQELVNADYSVMPLIAYAKDHRAETLARLLRIVEDFAKDHDTDDLQFLPIAGSAGIEAVTNMVVKKAHREMLALLYASVIVLCFITFRSWRAVVVALVPLLITAIICEALMVMMGIGLKVATLPVHAVGVGIGVDYALYLLSIQLAVQRRGGTLAEAYGTAVRFTGRVVALVGLTMAAGVVTWAWSPIKFQADMGMLLTYMFLWNMIGALILVPALSHFILRHPKASPPPRIETGYAG